MNIFAGIFFILHALVHLLYAGHALRFFELRPGLAWPDGAWAFSRLLGDATTRSLATVFLALTALGFLAAGLGLFFQQDGWRMAAIGAALLSVLAFFLFWDGKFNALPDQGGLGLLISLAILVVVGVFWSGPVPLQTEDEGINKIEQVAVGGVRHKNHLAGVPVAAFDTRIVLETIKSKALRFLVDKGGYAASTIARTLEQKGGQLAALPEGFLVTGEQGPLAVGELERAEAWVRKVQSVNALGEKT